MKSFQILIKEAIEQLLNEYTIGEYIGNSLTNINDANDTNDINDILSLLPPAQRGDLVGECINIFRDIKALDKLEIFVPGVNNKPYDISAVENESRNAKNPHGRKAIIVSRKDFEDIFKKVKPIDIIKTIISDVTRGNGIGQKYRFASAADPALHKITSDMIYKEEIKEDSYERRGNKSSYERTVKVKKGTGEYKNKNALALKTVETGRGIVNGKRGSSMDIGKGGRITDAIQNLYKIDGGADYCIEIGNKAAFIVCISRDSDFSKSKNLSKGSISNVYFIRKDAKDELDPIFASAEFLQHVASTLSAQTTNARKLSTATDKSQAPNYQKKQNLNKSNYKPYIGCPKELKRIDPKAYEIIRRICTRLNIEMRPGRDIVIPKQIFVKLPPNIIKIIDKGQDALYDFYNS